MKSAVLFVAVMLSYASWGQWDSLRTLEMQEVEISTFSHKEVAYKDSRYYIMDFHIDSNGTFVLLNRFKQYYIYDLDENMEQQSEMHIPFHPKSLFLDCTGALHILSKDSMYQIERVDTGLYISERYPIERYVYYFKDCIASTDEAKIFMDVRNHKQTTEFYQIGKYDLMTKDIYTIEDSISLRSIKDTEAELKKDEMRIRRKYDQSVMSQNPSWEDQTMARQPRRDRSSEIQRHLDRRQFYGEFVIRPFYNGLFVLNDTIHIFDHVNGYRIRLNNKGDIIDKVEIDYHNAKKWKGEMHLDQEHGKFYSVEEIHGAQVFGLISKKNMNVIRRTKITRHAYPDKVIVYNGYAYYVYRQYFDDNLNKLFRQKL